MNPSPSKPPFRRAGQAALLALMLAPALVASAGSDDRTEEGPVARLVSKARAEGASFATHSLFRADGPVRLAGPEVASALNDGTVLQLQRRALRALLQAPPASLTLPLPGTAGVELELVKVDVVTADFSVLDSASGGKPVAYQHGAHYRGVVRAYPGSLAAVSIFDNEIMAIVHRADAAALVIGRLEQRKDGAHVLYAEDDLTQTFRYSCGNSDDGEKHDDGDAEFAEFLAAQQTVSTPGPEATLARCVRIYVETDRDLFVNKGSVAAVTNYVTGLFNQSATLYANDSVPISLSQVFVWSTTSPYTSNSSSGLLSQFQSYRNSFNGDLGHLLALRGGGGIAAGFNGFCNSNLDNRQCFSGINSTYSNVPTYSWTVMVFTHEMGHLMGSRHTHACVWNGNNTAIDGCAAPEGSCARPGIPSAGGTIMSYCHQQSVGIRFPNGFGSQPGNTIRSRFNSASCLQDCSGGGCSGGTLYTGTFTGTGQTQYKPSTTGYASSTSGTHRGVLTGPGGTDFDLYLQKQSGTAWNQVAAAEGSTSSETINYNGTSGSYRFRVYSYSGSGSYNLCVNRPQ